MHYKLGSTVGEKRSYILCIGPAAVAAGDQCMVESTIIVCEWSRLLRSIRNYIIMHDPIIAMLRT